MTEPASGLTQLEASRRLAAEGPNALVVAAPPSPLRLLVGQLANPMVALLAAAGVLTGALGDATDTVAIAVIVILNVTVGFVQEYRAERALRALQDRTAPRARVRRDGAVTTLPAADVVRGDLLVLESGDVVAADARVVQAHDLRVIEALLTGESLPARKSPNPVPDDAPLAERADRVFFGTAVASGTGDAVVFATGMGTEMGRIATLLAAADPGKTPLERQLATVGRVLVAACGLVVVVTAGLGLVRGDPWLDVVMVAVSLAVAAVPEGLPAIVTIALAVGVQRMAARHVLVRRLPAVETLGATTTICTDKTGTLTTGVMAVREVWASPGADDAAVLAAAAACVDAELHTDGTSSGDPTEVALLVAAREHRIEREEIERAAPRARVEPFDATTRRMTVDRADGVRYVKGAPEVVLPAVGAVAAGREATDALAARGLRVLAVARGPVDGPLVLVGLVGLADPPRPEAIQAVAEAHAGGIEVVMVTGDHPVTARAIAAELGIVGQGRVHARATPEDKLRLVRALKEQGAIVAMTGDGVNDAPAIREAHVGVAMGVAGTEVTREAASVVLADDNFASIVAGVREGRAIFDNIRKALVYLLSGNLAELVVMLLAVAVGAPAPLMPIHLLWVNLVTDGLPALALVMDPPDPDTMARPPRDPKQPIIGRPQAPVIVGTGLVQAACTLGVYAAMSEHGPEVARTMAFTTLVFGELARALAARSATRSAVGAGGLGNPMLLAVVLGSAALQVLLYAFAPVRALLDVVPLTAAQLALAFGVGLVPALSLEIYKLARRALGRRAF